MFVVGWGTDTYGARNVAPGGYDTCLYYRVILGLPVSFAFRGCVHVIQPAKLRSAERLEALRSFLSSYLGWSSDEVRRLPDAIHLTLRPSRSLKGMAWLDSALWLSGALAGLGLLATLAIAQQPGDPFRRESVLFLLPFWAGAAAFLVLLGLYLVLRRPSARQGRIRGVVAGALGPFSDAAAWTPGLAATVAAGMGLGGRGRSALGRGMSRRSRAVPRGGAARRDCRRSPRRNRRGATTAGACAGQRPAP
jgi:hypothetical protein